jgi:hypothetical protein
MIKRFVMTILGAVAGLIVFGLGLFGVTAVTSTMIISGARRCAREILVSWYLATLLVMGGSTLTVNNVWWGILFFPALRLWGPDGEGREAPPKKPIAYHAVCFIGCFVPPWGLYTLRRSRPFIFCSLLIAANAMLQGDLGQGYWAGVVFSLAVWGWGFVKKPLQRFGGGALKGIKVIIAGAAGWFMPPLAIILIPLFFAEDVRWGGVALQFIINAILWLGVSSLPFVGWLGFVAAYGHVVWFWWNKRAK